MLRSPGHPVLPIPRLPTHAETLRSSTAIPPPVRHLTQDEVADRWRMSARTLERWRWVGQGPAYLKLGASVIYRIEDVEAYEAAQRRTATMQAMSRSAKFAQGVRV